VIRRGVGNGLRIDPGGRRAGYVLGTSDPEEQEWLARHLRPGDVLYDLGANVGFFTLLGARLVGDTGKVFAFEPLKENFAQLEKNVSLNRFEQVVPVRAAVAATEGSARFGGSSSRTDNTRILRVGEPAYAAEEVPVVALDAWRRRTASEPPTTIKMDVEGAEIDALEGARETIAEFKPTLLVEVHGLGAKFVDYVREALAPLGYAARLLDGGGMPTAPVRCVVVLSPELSSA
jgi:FkbM family methyltransferase